MVNMRHIVPLLLVVSGLVIAAAQAREGASPGNGAALGKSTHTGGMPGPASTPWPGSLVVHHNIRPEYHFVTQPAGVEPGLISTSARKMLEGGRGGPAGGSRTHGPVSFSWAVDELPKAKANPEDHHWVGVGDRKMLTVAVGEQVSKHETPKWAGDGGVQSWNPKHRGY